MFSKKNWSKHSRKVLSAILASTMLMNGGLQSVQAASPAVVQGVNENEVALAAEENAEVTYSLEDLEETANWGVTKAATEGATKLTFKEQYSASSYKIPADVDTSRLEKIVCKVKSGDASKLSLKFFADEAMKEEKAVVYGNTTLKVGDLSSADLKCIGIMNLAEAADTELEIESITFVLGEKRAEAEDTQTEAENEKTVKITDLEKKAHWNVEITANENGGADFHFTKQYGATSYLIPEDVDLSRLDKVVFNTKEAAHLSVKFFSDTEMQNEVAVKYGTNAIEVGDLTPDKLKCIGVMGLEEDYQTTIDSVTFVYGEVKETVTVSDKESGLGDLTADCFKSNKNNNPIVTQRYSADPGVMVYNDTVYVYSTNDTYEYDAKGNMKENGYGDIKTINCFSSKDMVNWTDHGAIPVAGKNDPTELGAAKWANNSWAPCAAHKTINGKEKFFLYFADNGSGIGVLTSDSPTGPWVDPLGKQLISRQTPTCNTVEWLFDPAVFVDDDGTGYLYFGGGVPAGKNADPGTARVVKLGEDMISIDGDPVQINPPYLFEDSGINKIGDKYYYSYCSNWNTTGSGYNTAAIEYMVSDSPMGPFEYAGELFENPGKFFGVWGNNHHSMFELNGKLYLAYHARALETAALGKNLGYRSTQIDEVQLDKETGKISLTNPTLTGVSQLESLNPYETVSATTIARQCGIEVFGSGNPALTVTENDWTCVKGVDFSNGLADMTMSVKADEAMDIEVHVGGNSGKLLGTIKVEPTDGKFVDFTAPMENITGQKNVYFVFTGDAEVDSWKAGAYTFNKLKEVKSYGNNYTVNADGAMKIKYDSKWSEVRFAIPEGVDKDKVTKITVNVSEGDTSKLAVKALETFGEGEENAVELNAAYGATSVDVSAVDKSKLNYFGIMFQGETAADYVIDSVVFETEQSANDDAEESAGIQRNIPDLKDKVTEKVGNDFLVGTAITLGEIQDDNLMALVTKHFNAVTFGNELKPDAIFNYSNDKCPGLETVEFNGEEMQVPVTDFSRAEKMLNKLYDWNQAHPADAVKVRGHVLTWHSQTPEWFFHEDYDASKPYVDKDTMTKRHEWYIKTVLEHFVGEDSKYKDMFYGWDVVNEAVSDGSGTYRHDDEKSSWWAVYKSQEFIINAFRFANKYAPDDLELYYNDYNEWVDSKVNGICQLLKDVKNAEGTRIDGMGMQGHYATAGSPSVEDFKAAAKKYGDIVGKVQITELDFKASSAYDGTKNTYAAEDTRLAYRYKEIYDAVQQLREAGTDVANMTVWGVIDKNSWLQTSNSVGGASDGSRKQMPLLFDDNYQAKSAYWAFVDETKLEPEIKSFDILQSEDGSFANGNTLTFGNGTTNATVTPVWNSENMQVKVSVTDSTKDDKDAFTVYYVEGKSSKKVTVTRAEATETEDGYEAVVTVNVDKKNLAVSNEMLVDFAVTDGTTKLSYNDYTNSQEKKTNYYARAILKPYVSVPKGTVTIDGDFEDAWENAVNVPLTINLGADAKADAKLLWDEENLYVYADVKDAVLNADSSAVHEQDSLEVFVDENNNKTGKYEEDDKQYRVNYLNAHSFNGKKCLEENIQSEVKLTEDGYTIEMALKWTDITPEAGNKIGLELQINDANAAGKRAGTLSWYDKSGSGWENPSVFGTVTLEGSKADEVDEQEKIEQAKKDLEVAQADLVTAKSDLKAAQKELKKAQNKLTTAQSNLETAQAKLDIAKSKLDTANSELELAQKELKKAQDELATATGELEAAQNKLADENKKLEDAKKNVETKETKLAESEKALESAKTDKAEAENKLSKASSKVASAQSKFDKADDFASTLEAQLKSVSASAKKAKGLTKILLKAEELALNISSKAARGVANSALSSLNKAKTVEADAKAVVEAADSAVAKAQDNVKAAQDKLDKANETVTKKQSKVDAAQAKVDKAQAKVDKANEKVAKKQPNVDKAQAKVDAAQAKVDAEQSKVDAAQAKADEAQATVDAAQTKVDAAQATIDELTALIDELNAIIGE